MDRSVEQHYVSILETQLDRTSAMDNSPTNLDRVSSLNGRTGKVEMGFNFCGFEAPSIKFQSLNMLPSHETHRKLQYLPNNLDLLYPHSGPLEYMTMQVERPSFLGHRISPSFHLHRHLDGYERFISQVAVDPGLCSCTFSPVRS